ncbi:MULTISPECIES: hypothetical protein [unclassified Nocardia]|uniref:hypothetical protein n=1 Tax=unclassified Nocardia TaxID=2637762 RepID=UPI001CE43EA1|nr:MULTISPECIES: hypothetical protein [unclassified Nocardia]
MTHAMQDGVGTTEATMHLEYLYGPQWRDVLAIIERSGQLRPGERDKLNAEASKFLQQRYSGLQGGAEGGLAGLLAGLQGGAQQTEPLNIATTTAKSFGRSRNVQVAGMIAGQAVSPGASGLSNGDLSGLFESLGSLGAVTVVGQAVTAAVLGDLVGRGDFTKAVYDELMRPWLNSIEA